MQRREFLALVAGLASTGVLSSHVQAQRNPVIGFLNTASREPAEPFLAAFRKGLGKVGFTEGQNVAIEYRWAEGQFDRLPELAVSLVRQNVAVIAAFGGSPSIRAAKAATETIPIVFTTGSDPVKQGHVASLNRPGGNVTGVNFYSGLLGAKRLELLRSLTPKAYKVGVLVNPNDLDMEFQSKEVSDAAATLGLRSVILKASTERELDEVFATIAHEGIDGLVVGADPFLSSQRNRLAELAARFKVPAIFQFRDHVVAGGLMSYGASITDSYRQVGIYVGRILRGEKPADLPVLQPTKFEFVINLKTARALGREIPPTLLALADEVIE